MAEIQRAAESTKLLVIRVAPQKCHQSPEPVSFILWPRLTIQGQVLFKSPTPRALTMSPLTKPHSFWTSRTNNQLSEKILKLLRSTKGDFKWRWHQNLNKLSMVRYLWQLLDFGNYRNKSNQLLFQLLERKSIFLVPITSVKILMDFPSNYTLNIVIVSNYFTYSKTIINYLSKYL